MFYVAVIAIASAAACARPKSPELTHHDGSPKLPASTTASPADSSIQWLNVPGPDRSVIPVAVVRPRGSGPFPAVILLHGTHGFAEEYVQLAKDLASHGVLAAAACWFSGRRGAGVRFITPIDCPDAPPLPSDSDPDRFRVAGASIRALVLAIKQLDVVRTDKVMILGHSRGGGAALNYALSDSGTIAGVILNSTGYPTEVASRARELNIPVLMMHGTADAPGDGGSARTAIERARAFELALRRAGRPVDVKYYERGKHNGIFTDRAQYRDAVDRVAAFILAR
jgi:dienelactone hydrolase